jgi:hypothetical protein
MSPDERQTANDARSAINRVYDAVERTRQAIISLTIPAPVVQVSVNARDNHQATVTASKYTPFVDRGVLR